MEQHGFIVVKKEFQDMTTIKSRYHIPPELQSCHTAIVDGYVIEGHVPVEQILRMLAERPDILGLAVAGMPSGAPGMQNERGTLEPFDVVAFDREGRTWNYASYP